MVLLVRKAGIKSKEKFYFNMKFRAAKPDLQVEDCETLGVESVDLWPASSKQ